MDEIIVKYLTHNLDDCVRVTTEMVIYGDTEDELEELVQDALDEGFVSIGPSLCMKQSDGDIYAQFMIQI